MNIEHWNQVLEQIKKYPKTFDQKNWHCGAQHCFMGWAQILSGKPVNNETVRKDAREFLEISIADFNYYSSSVRKFYDFYIGDRCSRDGYDRDGYDRDGYSRAGYSRAGYDRAGYDRDGLDRNFKPKT